MADDDPLSISPVLERNGIKVVRLSWGEPVVEEDFGVWMEYHTFFAEEDTAMMSAAPGDPPVIIREFYGGSYGQISASNPTGTGTATWTGMIVGRDTGSPQPDTHDRSAATFGHLIMGDVYRTRAPARAPAHRTPQAPPPPRDRYPLGAPPLPLVSVTTEDGDKRQDAPPHGARASPGDRRERIVVSQII